jgi:hypothetical protein
MPLQQLADARIFKAIGAGGKRREATPLEEHGLRRD